MAKKTKPEPEKGTPLSVAITDEQRERWTEAAKKDQRTLSSWVRYVLDKAAK
jgi:hypothetical protein